MVYHRAKIPPVKTKNLMRDEHLFRIRCQTGFLFDLGAIRAPMSSFSSFINGDSNIRVKTSAEVRDKSTFPNKSPTKSGQLTSTVKLKIEKVEKIIMSNNLDIFKCLLKHLNEKP